MPSSDLALAYEWRQLHVVAGAATTMIALRLYSGFVRRPEYLSPVGMIIAAVLVALAFVTFTFVLDVSFSLGWAPLMNHSRMIVAAGFVLSYVAAFIGLSVGARMEFRTQSICSAVAVTAFVFGLTVWRSIT